MKSIVQCLYPKFIRNPHMEKILMQSRLYHIHLSHEKYSSVFIS
nr:MAG TPA: hypothetical protein [Microviridae sp.]